MIFFVVRCLRDIKNRVFSVLSQIYNVTALFWQSLRASEYKKPTIDQKQNFNQLSIALHNNFNSFFKTVQETNHFMAVGCLKKEMICILICQFPAYLFISFWHVTCISYTIKEVSIYVISNGKFWILRRNVDQLTLFHLVGSGVCFSPTNKHLQPY